MKEGINVSWESDFLGSRYSDWCERVQATVDGAILGLVVLGSITKQTEQVMKCKPVGRTPPLPLRQLLPSLFEFLSWRLRWWTVAWKSKTNKPFLSQLVWSRCFITAIETLSRIGFNQLWKENVFYNCICTEQVWLFFKKLYCNNYQRRICMYWYHK